jgi:hypothetical protein
MTYLLLALVAIAALGAIAWTLIPSDPPPPVAQAVDPTAPWVYVDHRTDEQRAADQAKVNDAWGLR